MSPVHEDEVCILIRDKPDHCPSYRSMSPRKVEVEEMVVELTSVVAKPTMTDIC